MLKEFRDFIQRGNVIDLAVAVIMGAAFNPIVKSLVDDIIMPPIGLLLGGVDFTNLFITLSGESHATLAAAQEAGAVTINYGVFINNIISFVVTAFAIFMLVKAMNAAQRRQEVEEAIAPPAPSEPTAEEKLLTEIRDLLAEKR